MFAPPPPAPSLLETKAVIEFLYKAPAGASGGNLLIRKCWRDGRARVCHVRITGDAPQNLRVRVRLAANEGAYMFTARNWPA